MAKNKAKQKKKNKKKGSQVEVSFDDMLNVQYTTLVDEIEYYQAELKRADKKAKKKAMKAFDGKNFYPYEYQLAARERVIQEMEGSSLFDRIIRFFHEMAPVIKIFGRLVAALVVTILSVSQIKSRISKKTLKKLNTVYNLAMSL